MFNKKTDLVIINRSFWPHNQVIGEALLRFAEKVSETSSVALITQSKINLRETLDVHKRGGKLKLCVCKAYTDSSSNFLKRALETIFFMLWSLFSLIKLRPTKVYIATDPPVLVPFIVFLYSKVFKAKYYYHLQDIHPEVANIVIPLNKFVFRFLRWIDNLTIRSAESLITLSEDMKGFILNRSKTTKPIFILDNPSYSVEKGRGSHRSRDLVFCGNAGRLQRIPLLVSSIREYLHQGGNLNFTFVGGGVYKSRIEELANECDLVTYLGYLPANEAAEIVGQHRWALLPIDDEVTKYAFPSKSSSYVLSGCGILAICSKSTSVARWTEEHGVGTCCEPEHNELVSFFREMESRHSENFQAEATFLEKLDIDYFVNRLCDIVK